MGDYKKNYISLMDSTFKNELCEKYPYKNAAHTLGYVGEVNQSDIKRDRYYKQGDYIGKSGIEKSYEKRITRGKKRIENSFG